MSAWLDMGNEIKARLERLVLLDGITVIVDRQKNIEVAVATSVAKLGGCVQILWTRGGAIKSHPIPSPTSYDIRFYGSPVLRGPDAIPADDIIEGMMYALQGWHPKGKDAIAFDKLEITSPADLVPDKTYLIYEFQVSCRVTLSKPEFKPQAP